MGLGMQRTNWLQRSLRGTITINPPSQLLKNPTERLHDHIVKIICSDHFSMLRSNWEEATYKYIWKALKEPTVWPSRYWIEGSEERCESLRDYECRNLDSEKLRTILVSLNMTVEHLGLNQLRFMLLLSWLIGKS